MQRLSGVSAPGRKNLKNKKRRKQGQRPFAERRKEGHYLRPLQGRRDAHLRHGRQPSEVHAGYGRGVQRLLHHQLPCPHDQGH